MARKTLIRQLIGKWGIMSVEMQQAYTTDMSVIDEDGTVRYVDSPQTVEEQTNRDIVENANTVEFDETVVEEKPTPEPAPEPVPEAPKPKRASAKAKKESEPAPEYSEEIDGPEWG